MNVIGETSYFYRLAFEAAADSSEVRIQFGLDRFLNERLPIFGTEYDVDVVFDE
jgi:hypothetical protein